jgi:hypothetical protein
VPSGLPGIDVWWVPRTVLEVATTFPSACLAAKPSHVGAEVDESNYRIQRPMGYGCQARTQSLLIGAALSHRTVETRVARGLHTRV